MGEMIIPGKINPIKKKGIIMETSLKEMMKGFDSLSKESQDRISKLVKKELEIETLSPMKEEWENGIEEILEEVEKISKRVFPQFHEELGEKILSNLSQISFKTSGKKKPSLGLRLEYKGIQIVPGSLLSSFLPKGHGKSPKDILRVATEKFGVPGLTLVPGNGTPGKRGDWVKSQFSQKIKEYQKTPHFKKYNTLKISK